MPPLTLCLCCRSPFHNFPNGCAHFTNDQPIGGVRSMMPTIHRQIAAASCWRLTEYFPACSATANGLETRQSTVIFMAIRTGNACRQICCTAHARSSWCRESRSRKLLTSIKNSPPLTGPLPPFALCRRRRDHVTD
jgi:hypothetical protein